MGGLPEFLRALHHSFPLATFPEPTKIPQTQPERFSSPTPPKQTRLYLSPTFTRLRLLLEQHRYPKYLRSHHQSIIVNKLNPSPLALPAIHRRPLIRPRDRVTSKGSTSPTRLAPPTKTAFSSTNLLLPEQPTPHPPSSSSPPSVRI